MIAPELTTTVLQNALQEILPQSRLCSQRIGTPLPLELLLLEETAPLRSLDADVATRVMNNPLYWIFCWASGRVLASAVLNNPSWVAGKRVIDFGCGSGVVAIAAALAGADSVIACDNDPIALQATRENARLNNVVLNYATDFNQIDGAVDLIVVADVLYDRANLSWLSRFAERAEAVLLADSRIRDFEHVAYRRLGVQESTTLPDLDESREFNTVTVYAAGQLGSSPVMISTE